jgi:peroxiredoxin
MIALSFIALVLISSIGCSTATSIPQVGDQAPSFTLQSIDGKNVSLSDFRGKLVLLVFTSVKCVDCEIQRPFIEAVYKESSDKMAVIDIYMFNGANKVKEYVASEQLTAFPALPDPKGEIASVYGVGNTPPCNFIINSKGIIVLKKMGPFESQKEIEDIIKSL